jgi:protein TonB
MRAMALDGAASGPLVPALAASVALHAAVLAGLPELWSDSEPPVPAPLTAWLAPGVQTASAPVAAQAEAPERPSTSSPRPHRAAVPKAVPPAQEARSGERDTAAPIDAPRVSDAIPDERADVAAMSVPAPVAKAGQAPAPPENALPLPPQPGEMQPDPGSLAQYRLALIGIAKRLKRYPPHAIERGWEGRVEVRLVIGAEGELARALVQRSSGHDLLDRQALDLLRQAAALAPIPPALRSREFSLEVPVLYELREGG